MNIHKRAVRRTVQNVAIVAASLSPLLCAPVATAATQYIQAEDAKFEGGTKSSSHPSYVGSGYWDPDPMAVGAYVLWTFSVKERGLYFLRIRYSNGDEVSRPMAVVMDGKTLNPRMEFPPNASWDDWTAVYFKTDLSIGTHSLRITTIEGGRGGANIDYVEVTGPLK